MNILIFGGDERNVFLYDELKKEGLCVDTIYIGTETPASPKRISEYDILIGPIPFSTDRKTLFTPLSPAGIRVEDFIATVGENPLLISGTIPKEYAYPFRHIDITKIVSLYDANLVPTAEGIVQTILNNIKFTIHGARILVLGFGKVGKTISSLLKNMEARVSVFSLDAAERADIQRSFKLADIGALIEYQIIVNTIPAVLLNEEKIATATGNVLIIDVASSPGGVDIPATEKKGIKVITAPGLPGKKAPMTVAKNMKNWIMEFLKSAAL